MCNVQYCICNVRLKRWMWVFLGGNKKKSFENSDEEMSRRLEFHGKHFVLIRWTLLLLAYLGSPPVFTWIILQLKNVSSNVKRRKDNKAFYSVVVALCVPITQHPSFTFSSAHQHLLATPWMCFITFSHLFSFRKSANRSAGLIGRDCEWVANCILVWTRNHPPNRITKI